MEFLKRNFMGFFRKGPDVNQILHTETCNLACTDLLMNPDCTPKTRSVLAMRSITLDITEILEIGL